MKLKFIHLFMCFGLLTSCNNAYELKIQSNQKAYGLLVFSSNEEYGTVEIINSESHDNIIYYKVKATEKENASFLGWYANNIRLSDESIYTIKVKFTEGVSLEGRFNKTTNTNETKIDLIKYGYYPQTYVSDENLISTLNSLTASTLNGWYLYDDTYYAKKIASPYISSYEFSDGTTIVNGNTYWFKCEAIEWKILSSDNGTYSLVSTVLLDAHQYDSSSNNYKNSKIRSWLNNDFYNAAFFLDSSYIQTTIVDNSASTTGSNTNSNACENTNDKVYLLSYHDYINATYFPDDASRYCKLTDYAKANGAYCYSGSGSNSSYNVNGWYWTRSPSSSYSDSAWYVNLGGYLNYSSLVYDSGSGVRPAITITI